MTRHWKRKRKPHFLKSATANILSTLSFVTLSFLSYSSSGLEIPGHSSQLSSLNLPLLMHPQSLPKRWPNSRLVKGVQRKPTMTISSLVLVEMWLESASDQLRSKHRRWGVWLCIFPPRKRRKKTRNPSREVAGCFPNVTLKNINTSFIEISSTPTVHYIPAISRSQEKRTTRLQF